MTAILLNPWSWFAMTALLIVAAYSAGLRDAKSERDALRAWGMKRDRDARRYDTALNVAVRTIAAQDQALAAHRPVDWSTEEWA